MAEGGSIEITGRVHGADKELQGGPSVNLDMRFLLLILILIVILILILILILINGD